MCFHLAPVIANIILPRGEKRFGVGGNINISCTTDGYPVPQITWFKDSAQLEQSSRVHITGNFLKNLHPMLSKVQLLCFQKQI